MRRLPAAAAAIAILTSACTDHPTQPTQPPEPSRAIVDALNGGGGNPFVFLKPPVVDEPSPEFFGTFNPDLEPIVEVCELDGDGCVEVLGRYTVDGGPGGESVTVDLEEEEYQVQIHFNLFELKAETNYRILTRIEEKVLAFADLEVVSSGEMRNAGTDDSLVFTNDKKTVPWKVRIDRGALCFAGVTCASSTVEAGVETTVTLTSSDGEEVDFHLPEGWSATVDGEIVDELTITIDEVEAVYGDAGDPSCFAIYTLGDPTTGEPSNCYEIDAFLDGQEGVDVDFFAPFPILAFCPDDQVLQAIADGEEGWLMTSVEEDAQGQITRTYGNAAPANDFGGCVLPPPTNQIGFAGGVLGRLAAAWRQVRPVLRPFLPKPLYAADIGFGGTITRLRTIFFWSRTPEAIEVVPSSPAVAVQETIQLGVDPVFHDGGTQGSFDAAGVEWTSSDPSVATVDQNGVVTGVADGTATISAEVPDVMALDQNLVYVPLTSSATVTVASQLLGAVGTADLDGVVTPNEWPAEACQAVTFDLPGGGTTQGEFCFMNDQSNMYVRSSYTRASDPSSTLFFDLDMDGDEIVGADPGDDLIATQQSNGSPFFRDEVYFDASTFAGVTCANLCSTEDVQLGGVSNGAGAYGIDNNGLVVFEMSHPLASGDETQNGEPLDVTLDLPDTILVRFRQNIADANFTNSIGTDLMIAAEIKWVQIIQ